MYYTVKARYIPDRIAEFHRKLLDGTIKAQRPDGPEIVASMQRACPRLPSNAIHSTPTKLRPSAAGAADR